jgi:hypothetical protein
MIDFTSTANIESIKTRAVLPSNSEHLFTDSDICKIMTKELHDTIVPMILSVKEDYLLHDYDQDVVSSQNSYDIPQRALGNKVKDVVLLNSSGDEYGISRIDANLMKNGRNSEPSIPSEGFRFQNDAVVLYPNAARFTGYDLRMKYFRRPNNIVLVTAAGQITAIDTGTKQVTLGNCPSTWTTATTFDFIKGQPGFKSRGDDKAISAINTTTKVLTFSAALPSDLVVGDWVAEAGFSPIAQIPYEVQGLLEQRTVIKLMEGMGDRQGLESAGDVYKDMKTNFYELVTPRADGSPKKFVRNNALFGGGRSGPPWW